MVRSTGLEDVGSFGSGEPPRRITYLVKAPTEEDAQQGALQAATRDESDFLNELGEPVKIRAYKVGHVFDPHRTRLMSGSEVFSLLYELDDDGHFDFGFPFDSDELGAP